MQYVILCRNDARYQLVKVHKPWNKNILFIDPGMFDSRLSTFLFCILFPDWIIILVLLFIFWNNQKNEFIIN